MLALVFVSWMAVSPVFPLNPVEQDTLNFMNLHLTLGVGGPNALASSGPEITAKYETMIHHPFVVRGAFDYRYGTMSSNLFPKGHLHSTTFSLEGFYYRGTDKMTGYLGAGIVWVKHYVDLEPEAADSLFRTESVVDVRMKSRLGMRLTFGLRFREVYSIEVGLTEVRPRMETRATMGPDRFKVETESVRIHDVRVTVGYLLPVRL